MREPRTFLTAALETSPKSLQVAEPSSENVVVAKQLSSHVLLDYGIFMDFGDVLRCGLAIYFFLFIFFFADQILQPFSRRLVECFKRVTELNFVNGLKIVKMSGGAPTGLILSRTILMDCLDLDATPPPLSVTF